MPLEIERKYLIKEGKSEYATEAFYRLYPSIDIIEKNVLKNGDIIRQGYLPIKKGMELAERIGLLVDFIVDEARLRDKAGILFFTLKGKGDASRDEIEHQIAKDLFNEYWPSTRGKRVEKVRLSEPYHGYILEIDVFTDRILILAEIEAPTINEVTELKSVGFDVTTDKKYKNKNLAK